MFERIAPEQHDTLDGIPEPAENPDLHGHGEAASMLAAAFRAGKLLSLPRAQSSSAFLLIRPRVTTPSR